MLRLGLPVAALVFAGAVSPVVGCGGAQDVSLDERTSELRTNPTPGVAPPGSEPFGRGYAEWSARFWKWGMEYPVTDHPFLNVLPNYDLGARQSGEVWYWGAPDGQPPFTRTVSMPAGKALFLSTLDAECSTLEQPPFYAATEADQRACSKFFADHIVVSSLFCEIDGRPVKNMAAYRTSSTQIHFDAPTPWVFGDTGGAGTSVGDGYYLMLLPLSTGKHTIHYGGAFHFDAGELGDDPVDIPKDVTVELTVGCKHR